MIREWLIWAAGQLCPRQTPNQTLSSKPRQEHNAKELEWQRAVSKWIPTSSSTSLFGTTLRRRRSKTGEADQGVDSLVGRLASLLATLPDTVQRLLEEVIPQHNLSDHSRLFLPGLHAVGAGLSTRDFPEIREADGAFLKCLPGHDFRNWEATVYNRPLVTFVPRTTAAVCSIIKWATRHHLRVRCSAFRHTWTNVFSESGQVLISLLPLALTELLPSPPSFALDPSQDDETGYAGLSEADARRHKLPWHEFNTIEIVSQSSRHCDCRIGAGVTNEQLRRWCESPRGGNARWTLPFSVVMVEISVVGTVLTMSHGAGLQHQTLSDLVVSLEFVNFLGEPQILRDPELLKCAAGSFGIIGVVTHVTLRLDAMTYARLVPTKLPLGVAIPFPLSSKAELPAPHHLSEREHHSAQAAFEERCQDYYCEWFWFPYQKEVWVHTWQNNGRKEDVVDFLDKWTALSHWAQAWVAQMVNESSAFKRLPGKTQAELFAHASLALLPSYVTGAPPAEHKKTKQVTTAAAHATSSGATSAGVTTLLSNALHFRRGISNMRVRNCEIEIPIPGRLNDKGKEEADWTLCNRAFWDAISLIEKRPDAPVRVALEMRIMGNSSALLAPQFGNHFGTCSIEVLTNMNTTDTEWKSFSQELIDTWSQYTDRFGRPLNLRPHWCKEWQGLSLRGMPIADYLKQYAYAQQLPRFRLALAEITRLALSSKPNSYSHPANRNPLATLRSRFSNPFFDKLLF